MDPALTFSLLVVVILVVVLIGVYSIYWTIKRYGQQTQEQTKTQMVSLQSSYALQILFILLGAAFLWYGISKYDATVATIGPAIAGGFMILMAIYGLFTRKKIVQGWQSGKYNLDPKTYARQRKAGTLFLVLAILSGGICKAFNLSFGFGLILVGVSMGISIIYYYIIPA